VANIVFAQSGTIRMTTFKQYDNLNRLTSRYGNYFRSQVSITNGSGPVWQTLRNLTALSEGTNYMILTNVAGNVYVPQTRRVSATTRMGI
jgi:hypothetical protein